MEAPWQAKMPETAATGAGSRVCLHLAYGDGFSHDLPPLVDNLLAHLRFVKTVLDLCVHQFCGLGIIRERFFGG